MSGPAWSTGTYSPLRCPAVKYPLRVTFMAKKACENFVVWATTRCGLYDWVCELYDWVWAYGLWSWV